MKWPTIQDESCPSRAQAWCGDGSDPTGGMRLVIKPEQATVCAPGFMQFEAFLETPAGETQLVEGLAWRSSNSSSLLIDAANGGATILASGIVTVSVTWTNMEAAAQVDIAGDGGDCCESVKISTVLVQDTSRSMGQQFNAAYGSKGKLALALAKAHVDNLNPKDELLLATFDQGAIIQHSWDGDKVLIEAAMTYPLFTARQTDIKGAIEWAMDEAAGRTSDRKVIVLVTDGVSVAELSASDRDTLVTEADAWRSAGGILLIAGIRAYGTGYALLQRIASPGFFLNVNSMCDVEAALAQMGYLPAYYCGGDCVTAPDDYGYVYGGYCSKPPPAAQVPDPNPLPNVEAGESGTGSDNNCALAGQLEDLSWKMPCVGGGPATTCTCRDPADQIAIAQGSAGQTYSVVLRVRGLVEGKPYVGYGASGSASGHVFTASNPLASVPILPTHAENEYALQISSPAALYFLNSRTTPPTASEVVDYQMTVQIKTGARVTLKARSIDGLQFKNDGDLSVGGSPPPVVVSEAYNGQFLQINVVSIT